MAGFYPDVPGRRMAWDADGTLLLQTQIGPNYVHTIEVSDANKALLNNEEADTLNAMFLGDGWQFYNTWIFPELREVDGIYLGSRTTFGTSPLEVSADTTNGEDGTWSTSVASLIPNNYIDAEGYREDITSLAENAVRAVRWHSAETGGGGGTYLESAHLYGEISPGETPDKLIFIDEATGLEFGASLDFGDTPRGGSEDFEFRIRNDSATLVCNTIQYTAEALWRDSDAWYTFTLPGGATYQATRQIASLAAATTSGLITGRRITPAAEELGLHAGRIKVTHTSFS